VTALNSDMQAGRSPPALTPATLVKGEM
jgi:hypothetical protein